MLIGWLFITAPDFFLAPTSDLPTEYFCNEYDLEQVNNSAEKTDSLCYVSTFQIVRKKHTLTIVTDNYYEQFGVLSVEQHSNSASSPRVHVLTKVIYAVVIGEPDQLFAIREMRYLVDDVEVKYVLVVHPTRLGHQAHKDVRGRVLIISSEPICEIKEIDYANN